MSCYDLEERLARRHERVAMLHLLIVLLMLVLLVVLLPLIAFGRASSNWGKSETQHHAPTMLMHHMHLQLQPVVVDMLHQPPASPA